MFVATHPRAKVLCEALDTLRRRVAGLQSPRVVVAVWLCFSTMPLQVTMAQKVPVQEASAPANEAAAVSSTPPAASAQAASNSAPQQPSPQPAGARVQKAPVPAVAEAPNALVVEKGPVWAAEENHISFKDVLTGASVVIALLAFTFSAYTRWRTANQAYYAHLSKIWYDLRKEELKSPEWLEPSKTSMYGLRASEVAPTPYDAHAWSCWALAEDWYETYGRPKWFHAVTRAVLFKALFPNELSQFEGTVRSVTELHWAWLQRPEHLRRFDIGFVSWVRTRFLEARAEKLEVSTVANAGAGVRAKAALLRGQFIGFLSGKPATARGIHTLQMGEDMHLLLDEPLRFLNHSSTPNAVVRGRSLFACEDIAAGGEIFIDYACTEETFTFGQGPDLGYASLNEQERQARVDRLHVWLQERRESKRNQGLRRSV